MKIKRVVTGRNAAGESVFLSVGDAPRTHDWRHLPGMSVTQLWSTPASPQLEARVADPTETSTSILPDVGGTQFVIVALPPDRAVTSPSFDAAGAAEEQRLHMPGLADTFERDDPGMHTTNSIDYGIVLRGEICLELDAGRTERLRAGDVIVQNGTRHAWRNPGDEVALMAFILIGAARK